MRSDWVVLIIVAGVVTIELFALSQGVNGKSLAATMVVLGGLGGIKFRDLFPKG